MTELSPRDGRRTAVLEIAQHRDSEGVVIELEGELDLSTAVNLEHQLDELAPEKPRRVLIDLRSLDFMDSTGLALLVRAKEAADRVGQVFCLRAGNRQVHRLFELSGLAGGFTFVGPERAR